MPELQEQYVPCKVYGLTGTAEKHAGSKMNCRVNKSFRKRDITAINLLYDRYDPDIMSEDMDAEEEFAMLFHRNTQQLCSLTFQAQLQQ